MVKYKFAKAQSLTMFSFDFFKQTVRKHIYIVLRFGFRTHNIQSLVI